MVKLPLNADGWRALELVRETCPSAIIAGGCLRDALLGKPIADVDVYVTKKEWCCRYSGDKKVQTDLNGLWFKIESREGTYPDSEIVAYRLRSDTNFNLIVVNGGVSTTEYVRRFTCGLSMVWMRLHSYEITRTNSFNKDVNNKTITWFKDGGYYNPHRMIRENKYMNKIGKKYPDYKIVSEYNYKLEEIEIFNDIPF